MREYEHSSPLIAGSLLIAHPDLLDPNFRRSVLFLSSHSSADGAFGVILNRPTGQTAFDLLQELEGLELAEVPVYLGGPVGVDRLMFAAFHWDEIAETVSCEVHLSIERANELVESKTTEVRAFVGYAGWSANQLEAELAQKAWIVRESSREVIDAAACQSMWNRMIGELGPYFRLLAAAPDDPSLN